MIVLGVDPGTLATGYGVLEGSGGTCRVLEYGAVMNKSNRAMALRLKEIYTRLTSVIEKFHPDELAIETAFYGKNAQSALKLGHARGVSILTAVMHEIPTTEYSPREVKKAVVGNGAASKEQVQAMVGRLLKLKSLPRQFDVSDALAVALCHLQRSRRSFSAYSKTPSKRYRSWKEFVDAHPERTGKRP
jgi:crossover junction endodeoxyribonuclease RuvC